MLSISVFIRWKRAEPCPVLVAEKRGVMNATHTDESRTKKWLSMVR